MAGHTEMNVLMSRAYKDQPSEGLFTEGSFVLVEGRLTEEEAFVVIALGHSSMPRARDGHVGGHDYLLM